MQEATRNSLEECVFSGEGGQILSQMTFGRTVTYAHCFLMPMLKKVKHHCFALFSIDGVCVYHFTTTLPGAGQRVQGKSFGEEGTLVIQQTHRVPYFFTSPSIVEEQKTIHNISKRSYATEQQSCFGPASITKKNHAATVQVLLFWGASTHTQNL